MIHLYTVLRCGTCYWGITCHAHMQSQVKYVTPDCTPLPATDHHHCWLMSSFPVSLSWSEWYASWTESSIPVVTTEWCTISLIKTNTRYHCATLPLQQGKARQDKAMRCDRLTCWCRWWGRSESWMNSWTHWVSHRTTAPHNDPSSTDAPSVDNHHYCQHHPVPAATQLAVSFHQTYKRLHKHGAKIQQFLMHFPLTQTFDGNTKLRSLSNDTKLH